MATVYKVYATPRTALQTYGTEIEISDYVLEANIGQITRSIDSTDYDIGIYNYSDVQLVCDLSTGYLGDQSDSRSIFPFSRDLAKIRIEFNYNGSATSTYYGLINDQATVVDAVADTVSFTMVGYDSVFSKSQIPAGSISNGSSASAAFIAILNTSDIRSVLNISAPNINPANNITIDLGAPFDNLNKNDAINQLLLATNSAMLIDSSHNVIIKSRADNGNSALNLYGRGDLEGRENIVSIKNYNVGLQRLFNSVIVTGGSSTSEEAHDATSIQQFGLNQKSISLSWITNTTTLTSIATALMNEFRWPKIELEVDVTTDLVTSNNLLDLVSINNPYFAHPTGQFLPICGVTVCGDTASPLPTISGAVNIDPSLAFKIIEISEDPQNFLSTLKLRQRGTSLTDGVF